jgi:GGDEF domain-containing protein
VSIGIASRPASEIDLDRMIAQADAALYEAKRRGRDLVVCHEASEPQP